MNEITERCDFQIGDCIDEKFTIEKQLGEGTFGKVFRVKKRNTNQQLALKLFKFWEMPPDQRQAMFPRFQMEYETGQIKSKYLVHSLEYGFVKGNPYIVMDFFPKGDLLQLVQKKRNVNFAKIGNEVLYGLKDLHQCGKIHRDLKPENVLINEDGTAVLTDFGIAGDRKKKITVTDLFGRPTEITGTVIYMAPEQIQPKNREVTVLPTMDIFAFGVMMYHLITGDYPFGRLKNEDDMVSYIKNAREGKWNKYRLYDYPDGQKFDKAITGCLKPDFRQRLQTVDMVLSLMPSCNDFSYKNQCDPKQLNVENGVLLRVMQGEDYGKVYKLNDLLSGKRKMITVGCKDISVTNHLQITENFSQYISRKHCTLELESDNQWFIRDGQWDNNASNGWKQSLNGTFVNATEVPSLGIPIQPGDIISIGDTKLRVEGY